ncbi:AAA family ATPase [Candidatus Woesearchaeota archaeon]|nr:AAA family ATPase [Candidatus Woesearchaeota archaeon]
MRKAIIITGTAGSGKTLVAKRLSKLLKLPYLDVKELIIKNKLYDGYDKKLKTRLIDVKKLNKFLISLIKKSQKTLIIDSHLGHYLPRRYVNLCIITKCNLKTLLKRLKKRKYNKVKIKENIEAEILKTCYYDAKEMGHKIIEIDTTNIKGINKQLRKIR